LSDKDGDGKNLERLKSLPWPAVEELEMESRFLKLDSLFAEISTCAFSNTLKTLILISRHKEDLLIVGKLNLPQMNKLIMHLPAPMVDLDFIFPGCPSLTHLEIEADWKSSGSMTTRSMKKLEEKQRTSLIKFVEPSNSLSMMESNIWTLLDELRLVKILWKFGDVPRARDWYAILVPFTGDLNDDEKIAKEKYEFTRQHNIKRSSRIKLVPLTIRFPGCVLCSFI